jgi:hypothetical protein
MLQSLRDLLAYNKKLEDIQHREDADTIVPGVGPITLSGMRLVLLVDMHLGTRLTASWRRGDKVQNQSTTFLSNSPTPCLFLQK